MHKKQKPQQQGTVFFAAHLRGDKISLIEDRRCPSDRVKCGNRRGIKENQRGMSTHITSNKCNHGQISTQFRHQN